MRGLVTWLALIAGLVGSGYGLWRYQNWWRHGNAPIARHYGQIAPDEPLQGPIDASVTPMVIAEYAVTPIATYSLTACVLNRRRYMMDREADLAPLDLLLGWGPMSDTWNTEKLRFSQYGRWGYWVSDDMPMAEDTINSHSANVHIIPATSAIREALTNTGRGSKVELEGYLVQILAKDGWTWNSSTSRTDTGQGACEVFYVKTATVTP